METSESMPAVAAVPADIVDFARHRGPFVSVYLTTDAEIENAQQRSRQRWKTVRADLLEQGAPEELVAEIDPLVDDGHLHGQCLTAFVAADGRRHVEHQSDAPKKDMGRWGALPAIGPLLEWHQQAVPHVVVTIDRQGADLLVFDRLGRESVREVDGDSSVIRKSSPGGWSQRRFQQRAENTWEENAQTVARELRPVVDDIHARLVVVAGDERAVQLLRAHLDPDIDEIVQEIGGGRSPDGSSDEIADESTRLAATVAAADTRTVLERFREERGQADHAADGPAPTIAALNEARVEILLIDGDVDRDESAWFGDDSIPIALSPETLHDLGVDNAQHAPLVDVLIRAALGTGARVWIIPSHAAPRDGVGALLR